GPYLVSDVLGEGGMGRVYHAKHTRLGRDVAVKVIRKEKLTNPQTLLRFEQEIHAAAQLSHPNVVLAFDAETADGNLFLSMEYVEGTDLTKLVGRNGPMPVAHACDAVRQAALGLQHAFERGMVHRDIKPSNLLYTPRGQVKVLDFGLAMLYHPAARGGDAATRVTQDGFVLGTPDFLAPEQAQNPGGVDIRADIYSLGATLFYLLTARVPFDATTPTEKLLKHITEPPPSVTQFRPEVHPQLDALVRWMMAKKPEERPQTPLDAAMALAPFGLAQSGSVPQPAPHSTAPPPDDAAPSALRFDSSVDAGPLVKPVRVKEPKRASSLPLLVIAVGLAFVLCGGLGIGLYTWLIQPALNSAKPLEDEFVNTAGQRMIQLKPGTFTMGSPEGEEGRDKSEGPQHKVTLSSPFFMSATEVTRAEYLKVMGTSPGPPPAAMSAKVVDRLPAAGVTWEQASEFCRRLTQQEADRRPGWEYRLPTEAEWEYAARCGSDDPFPWGRRITVYTHGIYQPTPTDPYGEANPQIERYMFETRPAPVGSKPGDIDHMYRREPNPWGFFDLNGNVWEWCGAVFTDYTADDATDPRGPASGAWRVQRGGAFDGPATDCRAAARRGADPTSKAANVGFRVVYAPKR
ncbi:MAG: SUMF1/EgtB/PvdO family nonheme iron enzyme, partial [Gemmataceae bacterium]